MKNIYTAPTLFLAGMLLGLSLFATAAPQPAQAALGSDIVCFVFNQLNHTGSPLPVLDANACQNPPDAPAQCSDGIDNDGDGLVDSADPGCTGPTDNNEFNITVPLPACMDSADNDGDGLTDYPADPGCSSVADNTETDPAPPAGAENTLALCSDTLDNDADSLIDLADPNCSAYVPTLTVTKVVSGGGAQVSDFALFIDGVGTASGVATTTTVGAHTVSETASSTYPGTFSGDCDSTGHVSLAIGDAKNCTLTNTFTVATSEPPPTGGAETTPTSNGGGNLTPASSGGGWSGGSTGLFTTVPEPGLVLGTTTSCGVYLIDYLRMGRKNNADEVKKLQAFLNGHMNANLPVTGFFGKLTDAAVRQFQLRYSADILAPWMPYGLPNAQTSTGYVYKTTLYKINLLMCESLNIPLPHLP